MSRLSKRLGAVLIDLSGTLHVDDVVLAGAVDALSRLRNIQGLKVKFVTNTTKESKQTLVSKLRKIGFSVGEEEVFTSLTAAKELIIKQNLRPLYLLTEDALQEFQDIPTDNPNAVLVGLAPQSFDYENMTKAFRLLLDGASLIAIHKARYYKRKDGLALGPGAYVTALEYSTGTKATVVGKPESSFFLSALQTIGCEPQEAIMIGDDVRDDIEGAMKAGLGACLVKTGKYRPNDENTITPPPTFVAESFAHAVDHIIQFYERE